MTSGGARAGAGRKAVKSKQLTARITEETDRKLRAEAKRTQPSRKRLELGKVIDDLAAALPD